MQNDLRDGVGPIQNIDYLNYSLLETLKSLQHVIKNLEERVYSLEQELMRMGEPKRPPERL